MKWIKASDKLPDNPGKENSVIIKNVDPNYSFVTTGFKNFYVEKPELYFVLGSKTFLTTEGEGNGNSTFPIKDIYWLDETAPTTLYALHVDKGSWDDHVNWVIGVFDTPWKADEEKRKIIAYVKSKFNQYTPEQKKELEDEDDKLDEEGIEWEYRPQKIKDYLSWKHHWKWSSFNIDNFWVEEFEVNKIKPLN